MTQNDIYRLEHCIQTLIFSDNKCTVHFEYYENKQKDKFGLEILTFNPIHNTFFLFHKVEVNIINELTDTAEGLCLCKIKLLELSIDHIKSIKEPNNILHYTVIWCNINDNKRITSYFMGRTITDIIEKFFIGKNHHDYLIYEIKLNPLS